MEGFLQKKGRGESTFGRRNWKKRWFLLDGQYLTYYENFDTKTGKPVSRKGVVLLKGCDVKVTDHKERKFSFAITHDEKSPVFLQADSENMMKLWMTALKNAATGIYGLSKRTDFTEYYDLLGITLEEGEELSLSKLSKCYRRMALRSHPDKGGDPATYERVTEAHNVLKSYVEEMELAKQFDTLHFEIEVEKGPAGVGLGMLVVEDRKKAVIKVRKVQENIIVKRIDDGVRGGLQAEDFLVSIDDENTVSWPLARVVQRLNDFRVPVHSTVRLTFGRLVPKGGAEADDESGGGTPRQEAAAQGEAETPPKYGMSDIDDNEQPATDYFASPEAAARRGAGAGGDTNLRAENEELIRQLAACRSELRTERRLTDKLKGDVVALSGACKKLKRDEMRLRVRLQQLMASGGATMNDDQFAESLSSILDVADHQAAGQQIPTSAHTESYLERVGLSQAGAVQGTVQAAQRTAISAAASVDPSGLVLKKWAASGDSAKGKLDRLEARLRMMRDGSGSGSGGGNAAGSLQSSHGNGHSGQMLSPPHNTVYSNHNSSAGPAGDHHVSGRPQKRV